MLIALLISQYMTKRDKWRHTLVWGLAVLGVANIMDAIFTLKCSETLDSACKIPVDISFVHYRMPSHGYSSIIIALCYFVLPLAGFIYGRSKNYKLLTGFSALTVLVALASFISAIAGYISEQSFSVRTSGTIQEMQMIIVGIWLVVWILNVCIPGHLAKGRPHRDSADSAEEPV